MAFKDKIYIVWRLFGAPRLSGANNDFCCRIGPVHRCFCGHSLRQHATPSKSSHGFTQKHACQAEGCACACYRYVPNEPEEIGEGFLSRRQGFNPKTWSAKCQCQHGHLAHDPKTQKCSACGCGFFQSNFLCVVCDCPWEDHSTVFETEEERERQSLPVREAYFPLVNLDWELRAQVLSDPTGGGLLSPRSFAPIDGEQRRSRRISHRPDMEALEEERNIWNAAEKWDLVDYCHSCATIFKSPESAFCSHCGAKRRR
ncbi:Protein FAM221A/B, putative [Angomonas deanei]|uniref:Protein FAM221A/B, putative n=1 Tax=Angomonas deanei TaxID=59799 RepID=A0A7G2CPS4_9TRYP|nr:Protein FAM221A/B, putative [Angomonas deanei]